MALPQRDNLIDAIKRTDALLERVERDMRYEVVWLWFGYAERGSCDFEG